MRILKQPVDVRGKRVTVMGLGLHGGGVATARWLLKHGAIVTVTDIKTRSQLKSSCRQLPIRNSQLITHFGGHRKEDFMTAEMVIRNPAVPNDSPWLTLARKNGIPIENEATLFFKFCKSNKVIGVTGTRGKSTTATMIHAVVQSKLKTQNLKLKTRAWLAGNIRTTPMLSVVDRIKPDDWVVLELSSWQLETMDEQKLSPHIAVVTNVLPDHLNRYASMRAYATAKESIVRHQKEGDMAVLNEENAWTKKMAHRTRAYVHWFSGSSFEISSHALLGEHNKENAAAAATVARALRIPSAITMKVLRNVRRPSGRLERIRSVRGVAYYNDTTATTPDATVAALLALRQAPNPKSQIPNIVLICGGSDKNLSYKRLVPVIKRVCKAVVFLPGSATDKMKKELAVGSWQLAVVNARTMNDAVKKAHALATRGDIVLLSPAAASFGVFQHEFDRGDQFVRAVRAIRS